ncbi:uncharacterized protein LOC122560749 isoform X1 [Chiloscyllium plagiosum]|uniref:uncharacterized protein LOC122560749 isoform X1 n=1 Tax=Chiloscyllium plagiosum TaxID=36176 RepID=UPI001CB87905|nr:uncharacterized protein LOC122560749 isoform X1 [Chiloscyllium plagiosum]
MNSGMVSYDNAPNVRIVGITGIVGARRTVIFGAAMKLRDFIGTNCCATASSAQMCVGNILNNAQKFAMDALSEDSDQLSNWHLGITNSKEDTQTTLRHCLSHEDHSNILLFVTLAAGLCVVTCVFLMLLACCVKKWVPSTCSTESIHKTNTPSKDGLLQLSVEGDDHNQSISSNPSLSEPSETCSYCFSDQRFSDKERKISSSTATHQCIQIPSVPNQRVLPSATVYKEKPFQIICSPSQPSLKETQSFQEKCHLNY